MTTSVSTIHPVPSGRLHIGDDGHANPDELVACIIDADARTGSSGLTYIAEHTDAGVLNEQARTGTFQPSNPHDVHPWCTVTDPAADCQSQEIGLPSPEGHGLNLLAAHFFHDAEDGETGILYDRGGDDWQRITSGQLRTETATVRAHLARLDALADQADGKPAAYVVPTEVEEAEHITLAGARGAILNAYLWTPMDEPATAARLSVYAEPSEDAELDLAGALDLRAQLGAFLPKLDAMIAVLAEQDGAR